jgi:hypothetical protein
LFLNSWGTVAKQCCVFTGKAAVIWTVVLDQGCVTFLKPGSHWIIQGSLRAKLKL